MGMLPHARSTCTRCGNPVKDHVPLGGECPDIQVINHSELAEVRERRNKRVAEKGQE